MIVDQLRLRNIEAMREVVNWHKYLGKQIISPLSLHELFRSFRRYLMLSVKHLYVIEQRLGGVNFMIGFMIHNVKTVGDQFCLQPIFLYTVLWNSTYIHMKLYTPIVLIFGIKKSSQWKYQE